MLVARVYRSNLRTQIEKFLSIGYKVQFVIQSTNRNRSTKHKKVIYKNHKRSFCPVVLDLLMH